LTLKIKFYKGNDYWKYSFKSKRNEKKNEKQEINDENRNKKKKKNEIQTLFENLQVINKKEYKKVEYLLSVLGFDISKIDKIVGTENKEWKKSFEVCGKQISSKHQNTPDLFKKEDWIEHSEPELRKTFIQYLGDYISKFRKVGWNHGNNVLLFILFFETFFFFLLTLSIYFHDSNQLFYLFIFIQPFLTTFHLIYCY